VTDGTAYQALFAGRRQDQLAGEASTSYLCSPLAPARIHEARPDVRLLAILREPARRAWANYLHMVRQGFETAPTFDAGLAEEPARTAAGWDFFWRYRELGFYHRQLSRYFALFDPARIHVLLHDDLEHDAAATVRSAYAFLGVDPTFVPDLSRRVNRSGLPRIGPLERMLASPPPVFRRWARAWLSADRRHRIAEAISGLNLRRPAEPHVSLRRLRADYEPDVRALERLIGLDLSRWRRA
jgi:hypothetical protein